MEDKRIANMEANSNDIDRKLNFHHACFIAYIDATYNPIVSQDKASFGVFLRDESRNHSIFIQGVARNVCSILQAEALGLLLAAETVK